MKSEKQGIRGGSSQTQEACMGTFYPALARLSSAANANYFIVPGDNNDTKAV